jgi:LysM repeat protein
MPASTARVINARQLNIRQSPGYRFKGPTDIRGTVGRGTVLMIDGGPSYADGLTWWHVQWGWTSGWAAEQSASSLPLLLATSQQPWESADPYQPTVYAVQPGDTLTKISNQFRTSVAGIVQRNRLHGAEIQPYQMLLIPAPDLTWPLDSIVGVVGGLQTGVDGSGILMFIWSEASLDWVAFDIETHVAFGSGTPTTMRECAPGQTVEVIGRFGPDGAVRAQEIYILPGRSALLSLPAATQPPRLYTVQPGDTLFATAARWQTTVPAIQQANGLSPSQWKLEPGQILRIR